MWLVMRMYSPTVHKAQLRGYGMARLGLLGGGGGISSESGSAGRFWFGAGTAGATRLMYSKRMAFVTGFWMLSHTAGQGRNTQGKRYQGKIMMYIT